MTYSSSVCINVRTMLFFIKYIRPLCAVKDLINYTTHLLVGDKQAAKAFFVPHIAVFAADKWAIGFQEHAAHKGWIRGLHTGQEPTVVWGNLVTEFQDRNIADGLLRLPCLQFWNYTAQKNLKKKKNGHHVTITELLLRLHSVATELHPPLQSRRESNEMAQHFLNIFLRLPKGNRRGREIIHPLCFVCLLPPPPRTATVLSRSLRHCNETKLKAISAGKCGHILF